MESLFITKNYLKLEATYHQGAVHVTPICSCIELEQSARLIAQSKQLLCCEHLEFIHTEPPLEDLKAYFETKDDK